MKIGDYQKKATKVEENSKTIQLVGNSKTIGVKQEHLESTLEPILSRVADAESASRSAEARTDDFRRELTELTSKIASQNLKIDRAEQTVSTLLSENLLLKKKMETLTILVERGPFFSTNINSQEKNGFIPNSKDLGTTSMPFFSVE